METQALATVPSDAEPALRALSELWSLEQLATLFTRLSREVDARGDTMLAETFDNIATAATEAGISRLALIDAVGLVANVRCDELLVEIGTQRFPLPDLVPDLLRELLTAADVRRHEVPMNETTHIPTVPGQMNGEHELAEPGFLGRTVARLRLPTLKEAAIAAGLLFAGVAVYVAFGETIDTPTA